MALSPDTVTAARAPIQVMLVDDSAVIRGALTRLVESDPAIKVVSSVSNGELGVTAAERHKPDVIILDIEMPVMDGLTALPKILERSPRSKVVMFSSLTDKGASVTLKAFSLGAVECLVKPSTHQGVGEGSEFHKKLLDTIKGLAQPGLQPAAPASAPTAAAAKKPSLLSGTYTLRNDPAAHRGKPALVAIGSSTGGPQALFEVIRGIGAIDAPIVITQHMPPKFTTILAQHIQQNTGVPTVEGAEGMKLEKGKAYVAPGGYHMHFAKRDNGDIVIRLDDGPPENFCKPAVDPMFRSAHALYGNKILAVILTGMGSDGLEGGKILTTGGCRMIAQDEASSVVWGMPGAVAKAGLCAAVLPLKDIGPWVRQAMGR